MKPLILVILMFSFYCAVKTQETTVVNEYFTKKECKDIVDRIIVNAGGEENIKAAASATYEIFVNLNLISLKISYKQTVKRHLNLYKMEKEIFGDKVITGFDGNEIYQSAYGSLFKIPEAKQSEISFTFQSSLPHQFVLKLKEKDYSLKYLGVQEVQSKKMHVFQHFGEIGEERHCFDLDSLQPTYSTSVYSGLQWDVTRDNFKLQNNILYPVSIKMKLNNEDVYQMTVSSASFEPLESKEFKKPNQNQLNIVLQPFVAQVRLQEIYKALQLFRDYDPVNRGYPPPEKVKDMMGMHPQMGMPSKKIGIKNMYVYEVFRGASAERLEFESYPYILKDNVHKFTPLAWDKKGNYKNGRNVLFADGSITFLNENQFEAYLQTALKRYPSISVQVEKE